ncbi:MAG: ABC transporter ATP-binding protein [Candidatus Latescibacteria bacterium]|jgi:ABC-2 type transport system ATP-binding protein|nr:ABC transporter ATP-binding protein [Candidatus Latescibacterota bacterium]MDP7448384.1 ABC transporter ATP-binding protein [Candidatus Latescibacterota bacterium]HJP29477.1 ABC transporter ATP-binding protein [Candidatus Latescibacterota bacterium]
MRVEIDNLWKRYRGTAALRGVSMDFEPGCVTGVLGENGSGKSTLFRIVAGVTHASDGSVRIDGQPVGSETRGKAAYLPETDSFYSWMSVEEQLEFLSVFYGGWDVAKSRELLDFMRLTPGDKIGELSQGQRARLKIVAAFSWPSGLVVMDEPFNGIDPPSRRRILEVLMQEYRVDSQSILVSTHMVDEVEGLVEHVVYLREGQVAISGRADDLRQEKGGSLADIFEEVVL